VRIFLRKIFEARVTGAAAFGLLVVRVFFGVGLMLHGLPKIQNPLGWMPASAGIRPELLALSAFTEFFGGLALVIGLLTPLVALAVVVNMGKAVEHLGALKGTPLVATPPQPSLEPALVYLAVGLMLMFTGAGAISLDAALFRGKSKR
jgi:putative oxidoreductase